MASGHSAAGPHALQQVVLALQVLHLLVQPLRLLLFSAHTPSTHPAEDNVISNAQSERRGGHRQRFPPPDASLSHIADTPAKRPGIRAMGEFTVIP